MNTKKINNSLTNYIISISLLCIIIPPLHYLSTKHTETYNEIMQSMNDFEQRTQNETKSFEFIPTVRAAGHIEIITTPPKKTLYTDKEMEGLIEEVAKKKNFKYTDYLYRLATCENKRHPKDFFDVTRTNIQGNKPNTSIDRGLFMINDFWHKEVSDDVAFDPIKSTEWTIDRINQGYQHEWVCDKLIRQNPNKYR